MYHQRLGFPADLEIPEMTLKLQYTRHAFIRTKERLKYVKRKEVPKLVLIKRSKIMELELHKGEFVGCTLRLTHDKKTDIVLVLKFDKKKKFAKVVTIWFNNREDRHKKLNINKYCLP